MPTYEVTSPDGRRFEVTAPEGATQEQVLAYAQANYQNAQSPQVQGSTPGPKRYDLNQLEAALRAADAAGNVEDARRLARAYERERGMQSHDASARSVGIPPLPPGFVLEDDVPPPPPGFVLENEGSQNGPWTRYQGGAAGKVLSQTGPWTRYQQSGAPIEVQGPDGVMIEFPAGTDEATARAALQRRYGPPTEQQLIGALRKADAAGDTAAAQAIARRIQSLRQSPPKADFSNVQGGVRSTDDGRMADGWKAGVGRDVAMGARSVIQGVGSLVGAAGGDAFNHYIVPGEQPSYRDAAAGVADRLGLPTPQTSRERVMGDVGEGFTGTGLTMGAGGLLGLLSRTKAVPEVSRLAGLLMGQPGSQVAATAAGTAAASGTREAGGGTGAQVLAGLVGSMAPGGLGLATPFVRAQGAVPSAVAGATRAAVRGRDPAGVRQAVSDFAAAGTSPSIGQATGNRGVQALETLVGNVPGGAGRMERFGQQQAQQVGQRMDDLSAGLARRGASVTPEQAGRTIVQGIEGPGGFMDRFRQQSDQLYGQLDQAIPQGTRVPAINASRYLAQQSSPISGASATSALLSNPKLAGIREALQADLTAGQGVLPYEALARVRSRVGEMIGDAGLVPDIPTRQLRALYGALSEDMRSAAQAAGPRAMQAFNRANNHFKFGMGRLERVEHVIDKAGGPEKVYSAAFGGINNGATTLRAVMQSLDKGAQRELTASFIRRMGRAQSGQQNAAGDVFSMETFLTNWDKVSPEAKRALFDRHGPLFSANMDKIARMAERVRDGSRVFRNPSGTARQSALMQAGGTALLGGQQLLTGNVAGAILTLVGSGASALTANRMARLLTNPKAVMWLGSSTQKPTGELLAQLQVLRRIGEKDQDQELVALADDLGRQVR